MTARTGVAGPPNPQPPRRGALRAPKSVRSLPRRHDNSGSADRRGSGPIPACPRCRACTTFCFPMDKQCLSSGVLAILASTWAFAPAGPIWREPRSGPRPVRSAAPADGNASAIGPAAGNWATAASAGRRAAASAAARKPPDGSPAVAAVPDCSRYTYLSRANLVNGHAAGPRRGRKAHAHGASAGDPRTTANRLRTGLRGRRTGPRAALHGGSAPPAPKDGRARRRRLCSR